MKRAWLLFLALAACTSDPSERELTGETRRFVIDSIAVPKNNAEARDMGMDIDGDHKVDNQAGMLVGTLTTFGDITSHGSDIVASGAIASSVEIVADDFANDDWAGVCYLGADGEDATHVGGTLTDGMFETELGGSATVHLPLFVDADPTVLQPDPRADRADPGRPRRLRCPHRRCDRSRRSEACRDPPTSIDDQRRGR